MTVTLTKWYLDVTDAQGRAAIGYWAALAWRGHAVAWHNLSIYDPAREALSRSSLTQTDPPEVLEGAVVWRPAAVDGTVLAHPRQSGFAARLPPGSGASVEWRCVTPLAEVSVTLAGQAPVAGLGYVECLTTTLAPWRLPIDELRWGRWIAADGSRSAVWLEWRGPEPLRALYLDGASAPAEQVEDCAVRGAGVSLALVLDRILVDRALPGLFQEIPPLQRLVPRAVRNFRETKWLSRGVLRAGSATELSGWAIHEVVRFR